MVEERERRISLFLGSCSRIRFVPSLSLHLQSNPLSLQSSLQSTTNYLVSQILG